MKIIRDEEYGGIMMIPLFCDWKVRRCNVVGCRQKPTTIITQREDVPIFGLCEEHFQAGNKPDGGVTLNLEWDDFDAFAQEDTEPEEVHDEAQDRVCHIRAEAEPG